MRKLTLAEANAFLAELMQQPEGDPVVLVRGKKPIAVILPVGDADMETVSLSFSPTFNAIMLRSRRSAEVGKLYSSEEVRRELGLPPFNPEEAIGNPEEAKPKTRKRSGARGTKAKN